MKRILIGFFILLNGFSGRTQTITNLTFEEAVKIGLERNVLLNQQKNQLVFNQAQKLNGIGNFFPSVNVTSTYQHQAGQQQNTTSGNLEDLSTDYFGSQINGNFTVFNGFRVINTMEQANTQLMAQGYLIKRSAQDIVSIIATQYLQVLLDQQLLKIAEENLKAQEVLLEQIQGFFDVGSRAITDVYTQDALTKSAKVLSIRARNALQNDKSTLAQTLQIDPSQEFEVDYPKLAENLSAYQNVSLDSLIAIALINRADLQQFTYQVKANRNALQVSSALFMPSISLFANYGSFYYSLIPENFSSQFRTLNPSLSYGASLTIPIFNRFQNKTQRANAKMLYENSLLNKQNIEKTLKQDVLRAQNNLKNALENYESSLIQFQAGELALKTQQESFELGIAPQTTLAFANQTYILGVASKAQAEVTLLFQKVQMEYALGILVPEDIY
jgi:outer membrane protein